MNSTPYKIASIGSGYLSIMPKPVSGEFVDEEFEGLAKSGITLVVSLLERPEAYQLGLSNESEICRKWDIEFINYPIEDRKIPTEPRNFASFIRDIHDKISKGSSAVVHCRSGIGRAGLVAVCVLMHENYTPAEALVAVSKARGVEVPDTEEQYIWCTENYSKLVGI